jgi:ParB-like chromosome segregation protein Spo0J
MLDEKPGSAGWLTDQLADCAAVPLSISALTFGDSPRSELNPEHVKTLADSKNAWPPILVHGPSGTVIDGVHRVGAAMARGEGTIEAHIYEGNIDDAFVLAVRMNVHHGLPLSRADRRAAAERIMASHPQWSNRLIAAAVGMAASTVATIRARSDDRADHSAIRVGRDGRARPVHNTPGRLRAYQVLVEQPSSSVRAVARRAGVSPSTVHDVRKRLANGMDPLPKQLRATCDSLSERLAGQLLDAAAAISQMTKDPAVRSTEVGRFLLRWLDANRATLAECEQAVAATPSHWVQAVARIAKSYAQSWTAVAGLLEARDQP